MPPRSPSALLHARDEDMSNFSDTLTPESSSEASVDSHDDDNDTDSVYSNEDAPCIKLPSFEHTPRRSSRMATESESIRLGDVVVEPASMVRMRVSKKSECYFPTFTLRDTATGRTLKFSKYISGGRSDDPSGACVTAYEDTESGAVVIVKSLPHDDDSNEAVMVNRVTQLYGCLRGAMVMARLARVAQAPISEDHRSPVNYSVVLMHYAGQPLTTLNLRGCRSKSVFVAKGVAKTCLRLFENGVVYTDLKPANVLYVGLNYNTVRLVLCDYGGLAPLGATDAVATYPPPEHPFGTNVRATERAVVYGLGVLLVCLFTEDQEYYLRFMKRESTSKKHGKGPGTRKNAAHEPTFDDARSQHESASLAMEMACDKVLGALYAQDNIFAALVRIAWDPKTTISQLIEAMDEAIYTFEAQDAANATGTPDVEDVKRGDSDVSEYSDDEKTSDVSGTKNGGACIQRCSGVCEPPSPHQGVLDASFHSSQSEFSCG